MIGTASEPVEGALCGSYLAEVPGAGAAAAERRVFVEAMFDGGGFPGRRDEDWRFSEFGSLGRTRFSSLRGAAAGKAPAAWPGECAGQAVFVNGAPAGQPAVAPGALLGLLGPETAPSEVLDRAPDGSLVPVLPAFLADARDRARRPGLELAPCFRHPLEMLNAGLFGHGVSARVRAGTECAPLLLRSVRQEHGDRPAPTMLHPRFEVVVEPGARATVIEAHEGVFGTPESWTNPSTVCRVGRDARLDYLRLGLETGGGNHTGRTTFHLDRGARVRSAVLSLGEARARHDAAVVFRGEGSSASLNGLFVGAGRERAEHHTLVVHAARHAESRQLYKAVLADRASTVFDGQVVVAPGAVGTDAAQSNRNLLLSDGARAHTQPRLEIHADDVKCAHGAAIGRLDQDALFYLRSRGLGALDSRDLLIEAFAGEVLDRVSVEAARTLARAALARVREAGRAAA